ncbi:MAG: protein-disulfide reductase DsbD family protein [Acidocella sp.]|nr:protein-disulfide reductase DsbD family protein [Acidocella sp.]
MRILVLLLGLLLPSLAAAATSNLFTSARDTVALVSQSNTPGNVTLALKFHLNPGWHIYWSNPGDAGFAPTFKLTPPASAGDISFPPPEFLLQGPVGAYVLSGDVLLPFQASNTGPIVNATANWLVCADVCIPEHAKFALNLDGSPAAEAALFTPPVIVNSPFATSIAPDGTLIVSGPTQAQVKAARFFPTKPDAIINAAPQTLAFTATGLTLRLQPGPGFTPAGITGILELTDPSGVMQALNVSAAAGAAPVTTAAIVWLGLAFLGGIILNLMPCVFPILAMKALAIARLGGQGHAKIRREAYGYTLGVLVAFTFIGGLLLGLRALGDQAGWGFQLQSPIFVGVLALLILAIALNLAGLFSISGLENIGSSLASKGSFFTGLLAVAVATPCTAPFMGGAIAAALAAPFYVAFGIFLALGLGLAAPFLLIALIPGIAAKLPRPGAWMRNLQRILSLPMFATFIWLAWVFVTQLNPAAPALSLPNAQPFSTAQLAQERAAGEPVFIDMTAAWCVTCLVNEHSSLTNPDVQAAFNAAHIKTLVGDWTNRSPEISAFLEANHRDGVPLYIYYPPNNGAPVTLPQILTPQIVLNTIKP